MGRGRSGLCPLLERSTAAKRPQPCHGAGASSICTTPQHRQCCFQLLGNERGCSPGAAGQHRGCSRTSSTHPLAPAPIAGKARRPVGVATCRLVPLLRSVGFLNSPVQSCVQPTRPGSTRLAAKPSPASPWETCGMRDASLSSQPSSKAGSGEGVTSLCVTAGWTRGSLLTQVPIWMEAGAISEISAKDACIHIYSLKTRKPSPHL